MNQKLGGNSAGILLYDKKIVTYYRLKLQPYDFF